MRDIPETLTQMQTWFAGHITAPILESDSAHIPLFPPDTIAEIRKRIAPSPTLTSEERLGIYQQQYWWRIINICQEIYPSLVRLFDYEDFNRLIAEPYLLAYPPKDWFLSRLGSLLPKWLNQNYLGKDAPLVLGLAELDLAYEKLLFTPLPPPLAPHTDWETKTLYLQPYVLLFKIDVDLFKFRKQLLEHPADHWAHHDFPPLINNGMQKTFALFRKEEQSYFEEISAETYLFLKQFQTGAKLSDLLPLLESSETALESFQLIGSRGWLTLTKSKKNYL